jgi:hypothetical protein
MSGRMNLVERRGALSTCFVIALESTRSAGNLVYLASATTTAFGYSFGIAMIGMGERQRMHACPKMLGGVAGFWVGA